MTFKTTKTVITLGAEDLLRLQELLIDGDGSEALSFLEDVVAEKIRCAQAETHRPAFEGDTGDSPAHFTQKGEGHPKTDRLG